MVNSQRESYFCWRSTSLNHFLFITENFIFLVKGNFGSEITIEDPDQLNFFF